MFNNISEFYNSSCILPNCICFYTMLIIKNCQIQTKFLSSVAQYWRFCWSTTLPIIFYFVTLLKYSFDSFTMELRFQIRFWWPFLNRQLINNWMSPSYSSGSAILFWSKYQRLASKLKFNKMQYKEFYWEEAYFYLT